MSNHSAGIVCDMSSSWDMMIYLVAFAGGPLIFESILWGVFSCLGGFAAFLWIKDSTTYSIRRVIMMATCAIMYIVATVHWGILLNWWAMAARTQIKSLAKNIEDLSGNNGAATVCSLVGNHLGDGVIESHNLRAFNPPTCAPSVLLSVNIILSDAIVLFRACTIWGRSRTMRSISIGLFTALLASSGWNLYTSCAPFTLGRCIFCDILTGLPAVGVSCLLNLWATGIVGYRAWVHKRIIKNYLTSGGSRTRSEKILALFVDSGVLYTALWVVVVIDITSAPVMGMYLQTSGLIQLVGMYPTVLVAAISWQRLYGNETLRTIRVLTQTRGPQSPEQPPMDRVEAEPLTFADPAPNPVDSMESVLETDRQAEDLEDNRK